CGQVKVPYRPSSSNLASSTHNDTELWLPLSNGVIRLLVRSASVSLARPRSRQWAPSLPVAPGVILSALLRFRCHRLFGGENRSFISVLRCAHRFRGNLLDGGDKCAIEGHSPSKVSGWLFIERIRTGPGALKSIQGILKRWNRRFGATSCAHCLWL